MISKTKLKIDDLIPDRYYCCRDTSNKYYFKFKFKKSDAIYCTGYEIKDTEYLDNKNAFFDIDIIDNKEEYIYCYKGWFDELSNCYEIGIDVIVDYLPENDIDKKNYIRREKINSLLKNK